MGASLLALDQSIYYGIGEARCPQNSADQFKYIFRTVNNAVKRRFSKNPP